MQKAATTRKLNVFVFFFESNRTPSHNCESNHIRADSKTQWMGAGSRRQISVRIDFAFVRTFFLVVLIKCDLDSAHLIIVIKKQTNKQTKNNTKTVN